MNIRFTTKVDTMRIPVIEGSQETAELIASQEAKLKRSESQSQPSEPEIAVTAFTLTRTHSNFFTPSANNQPTKRQKLYHLNDSEDEKEEKSVTPPPIDKQPTLGDALYLQFENQLAQIPITDRAEEKKING